MATRLGRALALAVALPALIAAGGAQASAVDGSNGTGGFCSDDGGTTVVVDLTDLGGDVIVRCAPGTGKRTGFELLEDAGFEYEITTGSGMTSVCRIEGRPAADEELAVEGEPAYRETCADMPPAGAYWSYWKADDGGDWRFSQQGPQVRQESTAFEGWSFALNATPKEPAVPAIDAKRPTGDSGSAGTQNGVDWTGGENASTDDNAAATDETGSDIAPWVAGAVIVALALLIGLTVVRRRSRS